MKDSLQWLLDKFPVFLNKDEGSNFYKSTTVLNSNFKDIWNDLFRVHLGHRLEKKVLIWKEQFAENDYCINFFVNVPYLKMVNCYKNDVLIYTESYEYEDEVNTFIYSHNDSSEKVIPSDKFYITVETWEEYVLSKGFPENDEPLGDIYDHDESLDHFGALYDIPRKKYVYTENINYANTEPPYNNRLTEDDYHYMNRILVYISHMLDTPLPVLEVWKLFGIDLSKISLINRERYLCKMYSVTKHGGDDWEPYPWEHKDPMGCFWPDPVFFFVEVDNHSPVYGQSINFSFTFMNMFGEDKGKDYLIDVFLDGEQIASGVDPTSTWGFSTKGVDDSEPLVFKFVANPLDTRMTVLESDDIIINIKGCNSADWYVSLNGSDSNTGAKDNPFRTLDKALSMVEGSKNVVVLVEGTFYTNKMHVIDTATSIISCHGATIRNDNSYDFFRVLQDCSLYLQGITLKHKCCEMYGVDDSFVNNNLTQNPVYLRINPERMCKPPVVIGVDSLSDNIYAHTSFTVNGTLLNDNTSETISGEVIELVDSTGVVDTDTTDDNGVFNFTHRLDAIGIHSFILNHNESLKYCMGDTNFNVTVEAMPTILTATFDNEVLLDDELIIGYDLVDYYGEEITDGNVQLVEDGVVVATVPAGEEFDYTPSSVGTHNYKVVYDCDETYVASESETVPVVVRRYMTSMVLECDKSRCLPTDTVNVTGVLSDELGNLLSNATVRLYDGETVIYTGVTDSEGEVSYSSTFSLGKHTLQWRYNQSRKYEAVNSNSYRIRVKESVVENINLFLYPDKKIGVTGTSVGLNVLALDQNGEPISTGFKLVDTYTGKCGEYPSTSYTTGNDGWWTGTVSTQAIVECHGTYFQAISTVDEDIYSNVVHVFDVADPLLDVSSEIYSSLSVFDKDSSTIPVNVVLLDEEDDPLPFENFSVKVMDGENIVSSTNGVTNVVGEAELDISVPVSMKGKTLGLRLVYSGRANAYNSSSDSISLPYMFSPVLTFNTSKSVYVEGESVTGTCSIKDEFNTVLSGKSIKLYDGTSLLDTQVSDADGTVVFSVAGLNTGGHTLHCEYAGTGLYHDAVSGNVSVYIKRVTSLDISVPLVLVYSDEFLITGTLKDSGARGVAGKTVKLLVGSTVVDSLTTNNNGVVEFTRSPVHMGTHSFQLVFDGTSEYVESSSTVVTREIGKETSVLQVSSPVNDASLYVDESLGISGSLVTNDNEKISGATVVVSENGSTLKTLTTDGNGAFTGSLTGLSAGTHSLKFEFVSNQYYTGSTVTRSVIVNNHSYSISANVDRSAILLNDSVTITGVLLKDGNGYSNQTVTIYDGTASKGTCTTDSNGVYSKTVTGLTEGSHSLKAVTSNAESEVKTVNVYEDVVVATVTGNSITLGIGINQWLLTTGDVIVDWGDGSTDTVNNPTTALTHTYTDGEQSHSIVFLGTVTGLGIVCFYGCSGLTSIVIPNSVTSIGNSCFYGCSGLTSVTIPDSVTRIGTWCFYECTSLVDYELYWETSPVTYDSTGMIVNNGTVFTIPPGTRQLYIDAGYPSNNLVERGETLTLTCDKPIIQKTETSTVTATLKQSGSPLTGKTLNYQVKHGNTVISSGTLTTNNSGQATISYTGTGVGDIEVIVSYGTLLQETYELQDLNYYDIASQSNLANYTVGTGASFTYDSNNSAYSIYPTSEGVRFVTLNNKSFNKDNKISIDFNITSSQENAQMGFVLGNLGVRCIYAGKIGIYRITISNSALSNDYTYQNYNVNSNTWYTLELLPSGVLNLKQDNTIVATCNYDISSMLTDNNSLKLYVAYNTDTRILLRNINVKAL